MTLRGKPRFVRDFINLIDCEDQGLAALPKPLPDFPLGGPYVLARVDNPEYHIRLFYGLLRDTDHEAPELIFGRG